MDEAEKVIREAIKEAESELTRMERRQSAISEQIDGLRSELAGLQAALRRHRVRQGAESAEPNIEVDEDLRSKFKDMTQKDALIQIARENGGILQGKAACILLVRAGQFASTREAQNSVYRTLSRYSYLFQKVRRGAYRLVEPQAANGAGTARLGAESRVTT